jgi:hypothetical protein
MTNMVDLLTSVDEIFPPALRELGVFILGLLISGWSGYLWGKRSQKEVAKLNAQIAVLAIIDKVKSDASKDYCEILHMFASTKDQIRDSIFGFSCQLAESNRQKIEAAWNEYEKLEFGNYWPPTQGKPDMENFTKDQKAMLEALENMRIEIQKN